MFAMTMNLRARRHWEIKPIQFALYFTLSAMLTLHGQTVLGGQHDIRIFLNRFLLTKETNAN
jgi:hypothetical protein